MRKKALFETIPQCEAPSNLSDKIMERIYADKYERKYRNRIITLAAMLLIVVFSAIGGYKFWYDSKHLVIMEFSYTDPKAADVRVTGDFSAWNTSGISLKNNNDIWSVRIKVPEGSYRYMFIVDGKTLLDPVSPKIKDPYGDETSVKTTRSNKEEI